VLSFDQLRTMAAASRGFTADALLHFILRYGKDFVTLYPRGSFIGTFPEIFNNFKSFFAEGDLAPIFDTLPVPFDSMNWITVSMMKDNYDFGSHLQNGNVFDIHFAGLRGPHVKRLSDQFFTSLNFSQFSYLTSDALRVLTISQVQNIPPETFWGILPSNVKFLSPTVVPYLSVQQLDGLRASHFEEMSCDQVYALTKDQMIGIKDHHSAEIEIRIRWCNENFPRPTSSTSSKTSESTSNPTSSTRDENVTTRPDHLDDQTVFIVLALIIAGLLVIGIIVVLITFYKQRPRTYVI